MKELVTRTFVLDGRDMESLKKGACTVLNIEGAMVQLRFDANGGGHGTAEIKNILRKNNGAYAPDLAQRLNLPKVKVWNKLYTLREGGMVKKDKSGLWKLTAKAGGAKSK